jgi:DNA-binding transcriptional regulator YhcF (GntR family)
MQYPAARRGDIPRMMTMPASRKPRMTPVASQLPLMVEQVKGRLRARIGVEWRIGDRLPPIADLARQIGTGERNTYYAVRQLVEEGLLASRPRHGTFVANRPSESQPLGERARYRIHVPLGPEREGMHHRTGRAFADEMERRGYRVEFGEDLVYRNREAHWGDIDKADALLLINEEWTQLTPPEGQVLCVISTSGAQTPASLVSRYDLVGPDNEQGGRLAGQFARLMEIGDPAFVGVRESGGGYSDVDAARLGGFERGFGRPLPANRRFYVESYSSGDGALFARIYASMRSKPEFLFASSDDIAAGFAIGGLTLDLLPRRDYLLMGFDGQSHARRATVGGITTVAAPCRAMGRHAAEFLDSRLQQPDLPPRRIALGCVIRRGKTTPIARGPHQPFWNDDVYWPAPPQEQA